MYFKILLSAVFILFIFCGCSQPTEQTEDYYLQELAHLHLEDVVQNLPEDTEIRAVWIPVMIYENWMENKSETQFRENVHNAFQNCTDLGLNTVFVHVRAYCDAYYPSELFPSGSYLTGDYDPLKIMLEEGHQLGLSIHAWINPMRAQSVQKMASLDEKYLLRQWYDTKNGSYLVNYDGRYYLNPAYPEVRQLIADGITEIMQNYDIDGIHIDDYFYPTPDPEFDRQAFSESSAPDLAEWRRNNCNELIKLLYQTVKENNPEIPFSISPQGNFDINYNQLYADVRLWSSEPGYCDIIIPQIYYGFRNDTCPFAETIQLWAETVTVPKLVIGLGAYKIGYSDQWAGSGQSEFLTDSTVISREVEFVSELDNISGIALYSYTSIFEPEQQVSALVNAEKEQISELLHKNTAPAETEAVS
ncbi:MAG: hypothetical protein E7496_04490 [Ruminococcus sp.]|nr:hypothetical protein [Ruminococcus sp.]